MILRTMGRGRGLCFLAAMTVACAMPRGASAQTGSFFAVLNNSNNNADSRRSITYYDNSDLAAGPLFSVFLGFERTGNDYLDPSAIDVDPATGDVYIFEFDNTVSTPVPGTVAPGTSPPYPTDTAGDGDLLKIPFSLVYNDWATKYKGKDVRGLGLVTGGTVPSGSKNSLNLDYVTYGPSDPNGTPFELSHSNTVVLPGSVEKIGEVKRNWNPDSSGFFPYSFDFVDNDTLFLIDDSSATTATDTAATDHEYRLMRKLAADTADHTLDHLDGGFNNGASQFWQSTRTGKVALDPVGHSEPESSAYYASPGGVRGIWVTESDTTTGVAGDDVAFYELDENNGNAPLGYRLFVGGLSSFDLDNDPAAGDDNKGKSDNIFVDKDSGDVLIVESGFNDLTDGIDTVDRQPGVLRGHVNYDNAGQIEITSWDAKQILNPTLSTGATGLVRGQWTAWDSVNDQMIFAMPGGAADTPAFEMDLFVLDLKVGSPTFGQTTSYLDLDDSVNLFLGDGFGDKTVAFALVPANDADFDNDGDVDGADLVIWQRGLGANSGATNGQGDANGDGAVNGADLAIWKGLFGTPAVAAAGAVPEPATALLALAGLGLAAGARRRRR